MVLDNPTLSVGFSARANLDTFGQLNVRVLTQSAKFASTSSISQFRTDKLTLFSKLLAAFAT